MNGRVIHDGLSQRAGIVEAGTNVLDETGPGNGMLNLSRHIRSIDRYQTEGLSFALNT